MTDRRRISPAGRSWLDAYAGRRFAVLLVLLVAVVAVPPVLIGFGVSPEWFDGLLAVTILAAVASLCFDRRQRAVALVLGLPTVVLFVCEKSLPAEAAAVVTWVPYVCATLFFLGAAGVIVRSLFGGRPVTFDAVLGAACGYLFLGLGWAVLYTMTEDLAPGSFRFGDGLATADSPPVPQPHVMTYFSFVTLSTVGYGDVTPVSPAARTFAWLEALAGQFYLAVVVAGLIALLIESAGRPRPAATDLDSPAPRPRDLVP
jgi:hypothetical protein